ncbi:MULTISPECIES: DoxX family protein [unclassified Rhodococcus (in: high G+C Gram-positive bacteria)]|uniref:DoxX family protein n=1 Tax=unclassified Rhodococcus (in: high G+C Gram-positive bacteria) TaxID=192944 RepID=UPI00163B081E|nr:MULTISPECIES: DoxX family protein [unclassified Rhodococcus (in: high G+C Gram-positive bacteria)]MBC2641916.1 DoxX family protein [Rhodococcus sp. 3A]MBC2893343.1 DoxX family protein [Rhodococcus sp. 4CII]
MSAFDFAMLLLRVGLGLTMAAHGYHKIFLAGRLSGNAKWFESLGMRPGHLHARVAAGTEIAAGLALVVGLFTSVAAAAFVALMLVAAWTVHRTKGFYVMTSGWEYTFVIATTAVCVAMLGAGQISIDQMLFGANPADGWAGLVLAAGVGILAGVTQLLLFYRPSKIETVA